MEGGSIHLVRGASYFFIMDNVPQEHPFYISSNSNGLGNNPITTAYSGTDTFTYTADPSGTGHVTLYYQCMNHQQMVKQIHSEY